MRTVHGCEVRRGCAQDRERRSRHVSRDVAERSKRLRENFFFLDAHLDRLLLHQVLEVLALSQNHFAI